MIISNIDRILRGTLQNHAERQKRHCSNDCRIRFFYVHPTFLPVEMRLQNELKNGLKRNSSSPCRELCKLHSSRSETIQFLVIFF